MHAVIVSGFFAATVALDVSAFDVQAAAIERTITHAIHAAGGDWRRLLEATLGVNGFFEPLTQALGLAARTAEPIGRHRRLRRGVAGGARRSGTAASIQRGLGLPHSRTLPPDGRAVAGGNRIASCAHLWGPTMADEFTISMNPAEDDGTPPPERPAPAPTMTEAEMARCAAEYRRLSRQNTGHALPAYAPDFDELLALANQLKPGDTEDIESIIEAGVRMNLNDIQKAA